MSARADGRREDARVGMSRRFLQGMVALLGLVPVLAGLAVRMAVEGRR